MILRSKVLSKVYATVVSGFLAIFLLASCALNTTAGSKTEPASDLDSYIRIFDWKGAVPENLASVLSRDRNIFEFKAPAGQKRVTLSIDLLKDGEMQTVSSMEFSLDEQDLNYLSISIEQLKTEELINIAINGNKDSVHLEDYFQDLDVQRSSVLGDKRALEAVNNLMYISNKGEPIDLNAVYAEKVLPKDTKLLVVRLELKQD